MSRDRPVTASVGEMRASLAIMVDLATEVEAKWPLVAMKIADAIADVRRHLADAETPRS